MTENTLGVGNRISGFTIEGLSFAVETVAGKIGKDSDELKALLDPEGGVNDE